MALKEISHHVTRPGRKNDDPEVTVPGVPTREDDVNFFSREYPIDSQSVATANDPHSERPGNRSRGPNA